MLSSIFNLLITVNSKKIIFYLCKKLNNIKVNQFNEVD
jgi:hypothetical protein